MTEFLDGIAAIPFPASFVIFLIGVTAVAAVILAYANRNKP